MTADAGSASEFFEMKTRPVEVATHSVPVSDGARSVWASVPPFRSPSAARVRSLALPAPPATGPPSGTKSPHPGLFPGVVNSGQFASRKSRSPALSFVRQTLWKPV